VTVERDTAALAALHAAEIPRSRRGDERTRRLSAAERQLYRWILREFAAATPPSGEATRAAADALGLDAADTFRILAREDLIHVDASGRPVVAYPFSVKPRGHRVLIGGNRWVEAMCAIDALGIAPMLARPIEIHSRDPIAGGEIRLRLDPGGDAWWEPQQMVVLTGSVCRDGPSFRGCCDVINFFENNENAGRYLAKNPSVSGHPIALPEAIDAGRIVFGDLLQEPSPRQ
jgi:hypothetical protein